MIVETEESHSLPSASWRPRKADGAIQSKSKGLRTRVADGVNPSPRAEENERCPSSKQKTRGCVNFSFLPL